MTNTLTEVTNVRLSNESRKLVRQLADKEQRSFSQMLRILVEQGLVVRSKKAGKQ